MTTSYRVDPVYASVGACYGQQPIYRVPKYQRSYAWDKMEIEDFVRDVETCFQRRKTGSPLNHFFGGIVSVERSIPGTIRQSEFELVDGQQRMATFVLLVASIISIYKNILQEANQNGDTSNATIIDRRIKELSDRFIEFELEINRVMHTYEVMRLSRADEQFFRDVIRQRAVTPTRDSHRKIHSAYTELLQKISDLTGTGNLVSKLDNLEIFKLLLDADFSLIHMKTGDQRQAYILFRVLNDRGKSLTDGDLLRARTLEILEGFPSQQTSVEAIWDDILSDPPSTTEEYLRWIYASRVGGRPGANTLFDDFLAHFFPQHTAQTITTTDADAVLRTIQSLLKEIQNSRKLANGEWPFTLARPITAWDVNRLGLLLRELRISISMPLLLAACQLDQVKFSEIVQMLERFMFRFKIIGNQHVTPAITIFHGEAVNIRTAPGTYDVNSLKTRLHALQTSKVNDTLFRSLLDSLVYKDGGGNQPIKYFLMTIEHYLRWYRAGATGEPTCLDKTRIYDFAGTTLEHVYPKNAPATDIEPALEPLKNNLGNLTFMGPADNHAAGNEPFAVKKPILLASSVLMNQGIGANAQWMVPELNARTTDLKNIACAVFNI
jgi:hypothetical protein